MDQPGILEIGGTYRGNVVTFYTDPGYVTVVLVRLDGEFVSGWKLNVEQSINLRERNSL